MCGIAGAINYYKYDLDKIKFSLYHRGPDEQNIHIEENIAFVHTRLAIQDIANGKQPFFFENHTIIFNGEIYNHLELRKLLPNTRFKTMSDTETLLHLYIRFKHACFDLFDGMFAVAIYDKNQQSLMIARDRAGKKPLYFFQDKDSFLFASELNTIKSVAKLTIDHDAINAFLRCGFIYNTATPYNEIKELEAGTYIELNTRTLQFTSKKYFDITTHYEKNQLRHSEADILTKLEKTLSKSIKDRLLSSDLEVGIFLSGGIDSNLITALASQYQKNVKTFTVKFSSDYDESHLAKLTAQQYQTKHIEIDISQSLNNIKTDIEKILVNYGEPFMDSSAIPSYYIAKEAKRHVTVALTGDGADELFGGYRRYVPLNNYLLRSIKYISFIHRLLPTPNNKKSFYNYFFRLLGLHNKKGLDYYLSATSDVFEDVYSFKTNHIFNEMESVIKNTQSKKLSPLAQMMILDFNVILRTDLMVKMDIATMRNSLEVRSPFLSKYMLEFAPTIPDKYKINRFTTKYLLRQLAKKHLPAALIHQPKRGFEIPLMQWVENDLKDSIFASLNNNCFSLNFIDSQFLHKLLENKLTISANRRASILWNLFCLEVWYKNEKNFFNSSKLR